MNAASRAASATTFAAILFFSSSFPRLQESQKKTAASNFAHSSTSLVTDPIPFLGHLKQLPVKKPNFAVDFFLTGRLH